MILIFGALSDAGIGYLVHRLAERGAPFLMLDPRHHGREFNLSWELDAGRFDGRLEHGGSALRLSDVRSIYVHHVWLPPAAGAEADASEIARARVTQALLHSFLEAAPVLVCNRLSACMTNAAKTYQQQLIAARGFRVPRTLVTNVPDEVRAFYDACRGRLIYKSLSGRRSIVQRMTEADFERLGDLRACPTQFQEWVPGVDIRVHVMGARVFATEILTEAVDYRYAGREGLPRAMRGAELPDIVAQRCLGLTGDLGLVAAGIDLRRSLDGAYYCFEANPTPAYMFYQQYTGQRIGDALADVLLQNDAP